MRRLARILVPCLLAAAALCLVYYSAFNFWAGQAPPGPHTPTYTHRGNLLCAASALPLALAPVSIWLLRPRSPRPRDTEMSSG